MKKPKILLKIGIFLFLVCSIPLIGNLILSQPPDWPSQIVLILGLSVGIYLLGKGTGHSIPESNIYKIDDLEEKTKFTCFFSIGTVDNTSDEVVLIKIENGGYFLLRLPTSVFKKGDLKNQTFIKHSPTVFPTTTC